MDNDKLMYTVIGIVVVVIAFPFIYKMFYDAGGYDAAQDAQNVERLNKAIENYATINQQFPPSLHHLVPDYLAEVPLTSTRQVYQYDPATGKVTNPAPPADGTKQAGAPRGSGGGVSPATDAITGLSVSEELNF